MAKTRTQPKTARVKRTDQLVSKKERLLCLLRRDSGATIADITEATDWQPHTARAMLTGLRKKGFAIERAKVDGVQRYAITGEPAA